MKTTNLDIKRLVQVRIAAGEDILEGLKKAVEAESIKTGVIVNGFGSSTSYHFHVVASTDLPPKEAFPRGSGPYDIVSMSGAVIDGRVHAHISFSDTEKVFGGHLEPGCNALTFVVITVADVGDAVLTDWDRI